MYQTERVFSDHERTVNRVNWHPQESALFLSGSQDGAVKLFVCYGWLDIVEKKISFCVFFSYGIWVTVEICNDYSSRIFSYCCRVTIANIRIIVHVPDA